MPLEHDRMVHAERGDEKIVRYDRAGKWYIEYEPANLRPCRRVRVDHAALRAVQLLREGEGTTVNLGLPGGSVFDRYFQKYLEHDPG